MTALIEALEHLEAPLVDAIWEASGVDDGALEQLEVARRAVRRALELAREQRS